MSEVEAGAGAAGVACALSGTEGPLDAVAMVVSVQTSYASLLIPFILGGAGMALVFAPSANAVLSSVSVQEAGQASGANTAIRELGGVLGIAVLATVFTGAGSYNTPHAFVNGLIPALWVGGAVLAGGALIATLLPFRTRRRGRGNGSERERDRRAPGAARGRRGLTAGEARQ